MKDVQIVTERLLLRKFEESDAQALYQLLKDKDVNTFLPWYTVESIGEAIAFYEKHIRNEEYYYAICLKAENTPIGYIKAETDESHDFGYALCKEFWHKGIVTEAARAFVKKLKSDGMPFITATHDRNNPRSGGVMRQLGMKYCYSYEEQWMPKNFKVVFRMYQLNLDGKEDRVLKKYWNLYENHFVEQGINAELS